MASRYHGIRPAEFKELAWWEQRLIAEGLSAEGPQVPRFSMLKKPSDPFRQAFHSAATAADEEQFIRSSGFNFRKA